MPRINVVNIVWIAFRSGDETYWCLSHSKQYQAQPRTMYRSSATPILSATILKSNTHGLYVTPEFCALPWTLTIRTNTLRQDHHHVVVPRQSSLHVQPQTESYKKRPAARIRVVYGDLICVIVDNFCFCMCAVHEYIFYSSTTTIVSHQFSHVNDPG